MKFLTPSSVPLLRFCADLLSPFSLQAELGLPEVLANESLTAQSPTLCQTQLMAESNLFAGAQGQELLIQQQGQAQRIIPVQISEHYLIAIAYPVAKYLVINLETNTVVHELPLYPTYSLTHMTKVDKGDLTSLFFLSKISFTSQMRGI